MYRRPTPSDPYTAHLWLDNPPTTTACGIVGKSLDAYGRVICGGCATAFGAETAEQFPGLRWLRPFSSDCRHAFEPDPPVDDQGHAFAICQVRAYAQRELIDFPDAYRCPHCVGLLEVRLRRP